MVDSKKRYIRISLSLLIILIVSSFFINPKLDGIPNGSIERVLLYIKVLIVVCITISMLLVYFLLYTKMTLEKFFFFCVLLFGCIYVFAITPLSAPDEAFHYQSSYVTSNIVLNTEDKTVGESQDFDYQGYSKHKNVISAYERIADTIFSKRISNDKIITIPESYAVRHPQSYIFSSIGIVIARILNLNSFWVFTFGRLANLIVFSICIYISIKRIPKYKVFFGLLALLPINMQQVSSYNYDSIIISSCFVMTSSIIYSIYRKDKITFKELMWILIPGLIQGPIKGVYSFIIFAVILIPKERFSNATNRIFVVSSVIVVELFFSIYFYYNAPYFYYAVPKTDLTGIHIDRYSIKDIIKEPFCFIEIFLNTIIRYGATWVVQMLGYSLSGLSLPLFFPIVILFGLLIFAGMYVEKDTVIEGIEQSGLLRIVFFSIFLIVSAAIVVAMFISHTLKPSEIIEGVQGRYFIPVLPLLLLSTYTPKLKIKKNIKTHVIIASVFLTTTTIIYILLYTLNNGILVCGAI